MYQGEPQTTCLCKKFEKGLNWPTLARTRVECGIFFWSDRTGQVCVFKNTNKKNICASIVLEAKTKEKYEEQFFNGFYFKTQKCPFLGVNQFFQIFFFSFSFWYNRHTNVIFISIFENAQKTVINRQKQLKWHFWQSIIFFCIFKNTDQKNICVTIVLKAESKPKHEETFLWGVFFSKT